MNVIPLEMKSNNIEELNCVVVFVDEKGKPVLSSEVLQGLVTRLYCCVCIFKNITKAICLNNILISFYILMFFLHYKTLL